MNDGESIHADIVAAAIAVVAESGYRAASASTVAARAGLTNTAAERHLADMPALMSEAVAWMYGDVALHLGRQMDAESNGLPKVRTYIRGICNYFYENPTHLRAMGEIIRSGDLVGPAAEQPAARRWQAVAEMLTDGQREGLLGEFDPKAVALIIGGAIDALIREWAADPSFDLPAAADELAGLVTSLADGAVFGSYVSGNT